FARIDETVREILGEGGGDGFVKIDGVHGLFPFEGGGAFPHPMKTILLRLLIKAIRETKMPQVIYGNSYRKLPTWLFKNEEVTRGYR
ncbi:hypothetical protein ACW4FQ_26450, partial [Escherichia coli]